MTPPAVASIAHDRRADDPRLTEIHARVSALEDKVDANTALTEEIHTNTAGMVEAWKAMEGGLKVLATLARVAKWFTVIIGAVTAGLGLYHIFGNGIPKIDIPK